MAALRVANLPAPFDAVVEQVAASEGASVKAGDLVVQLSSASLAHEVEMAKSRRELAETRLAALRAREAASEASMRAELARKQARRDRMKALYASRDVTLEDVESAENDYFTTLRGLSDSSRSASAEEVRIAQIELRRAEADARYADHQQSLLAVRAPFDGMVTRLPSLTGQTVAQREQLGQVVAAGELEVRADVAPELARVVTAGTPVEVRIDSIPPRVLHERIAYLVPADQPPPAPAKSRLVVKLSSRDASIAPGTPATLTITLR